ncbi:MAG: glycosyltransferase family 2 protein [Chitinophagaceae bacterium]
MLYRYWLLRLPTFTVREHTLPQHTFTIIIPARNEAENIGKCLTSVLEQQYPSHLYEVIVVDDHSTDSTADVVRALQIRYPQLSLIQLADALQGEVLNAYKKKAIAIAIEQSKYDYIVTTDADCTVPPQWLRYFDAWLQQHNAVFVAAPVAYEHTGSLVSAFQCLDFLSLQGITAAAVSAGVHSMCNGANLMYSKAAFYAVGGFAGIDNIASGDDMLLMYKMQQHYPPKVHYLYSSAAVVHTLPMPTWGGFYNQRIRWASKASHFSDKRIFWVLVLVYCFNLALLLLPVWWVVHVAIGLTASLALVVKICIELQFMRPVAQFYRKEKLLSMFPLMQPLHIVYIVVAGWLGKFGSYQWKQRKVH